MARETSPLAHVSHVSVPASALSQGTVCRTAGSAGMLGQGWGQGIALAVGHCGCTLPGTGLCTVAGPVLAGEAVIQWLAFLRPLPS